MNVSIELKKDILTRIERKITQGNITYIGNPLFIHENKIRKFQPILCKIAHLTKGWRVKFLHFYARKKCHQINTRSNSSIDYELIFDP